MTRSTPGGISIISLVVWIVIYTAFGSYVFSRFSFQEVKPDQPLEQKITDLQKANQDQVKRFADLESQVKALGQCKTAPCARIHKRHRR